MEALIAGASKNKDLDSVSGGDDEGDNKIYD